MVCISQHLEVDNTFHISNQTLISIQHDQLTGKDSLTLIPIAI